MISRLLHKIIESTWAVKMLDLHSPMGCLCSTSSRSVLKYLKIFIILHWLVWAKKNRRQYEWDDDHCGLRCCVQGRSQNFTLGGTEAERRMHENRGSQGTEGGGGIGEVVSPPQPTRESRPPTHFWHIWGPQNTCDREPQALRPKPVFP